jgi:flagellar biosynthesis GTPase FlhF
MELKRILAKDSRSAMDIAMARYGKDVLVVSSQNVGGQVELVVALDVQAEPPPAPVRDGKAFTQAFRRALGPMPAPDAPAGADAPSGVASAVPSPMLQADVHAPRSTQPAPAPAAANDDERGRQVVDLVRREIAALRQEFATSRKVQAWQEGQRWPAGVAEVIEALEDAGMPASLRALMMDAARGALDPRSALFAMRKLMDDSMQAVPRGTIERGAHAIFGPTGAGKTHMVIRIARAAALRVGADKVAIVSFNDPRCGAWSQTRVLATQAGVACHRAGDLDTLRVLLDELAGHALVLVDTSGVDCVAQAERLRATGLKVSQHLLVPADASIGGVRRMLAPECAWASVMIGKLDESVSPWPLLQALSDRRLPVTAVATSGDAQAPARAFDAPRMLDLAFDRLRAQVPAQPSPGAVDDGVPAWTLEPVVGASARLAA